MYAVFIVGTAGSGKSMLTSALLEWFSKKGEDVAALNLDPGVLSLPYEPDIDIRNYVSVDKLMEKYGLGPNGALLLASDIIVDQMEQVNKEVEEVNPKYLIVDTPGQMELFAFRVSGPLIAKEIKADGKIVLYLFDAPFCLNPFNYASNIFLSAAVFLRFTLPQLNVLSKVDLLPTVKVKEILGWASNPGSLKSALEKYVAESGVYLLSKDVFDAVARLRLDFSLIACSAKTFTNFIGLHASILRILTRGEEGT
ncbi:MAG: ATP/GTP-binding protein [Candidatus Bathyarchaeota archaeon]|nr:ATP/GTP-binding protein [Candidatus Bathyarchaeota archaeon]